jgi:hypothetical protein
MATSQSKMPPQQCDGLLDLFVEGVGFGGHGSANPASGRARQYSPPRPLSTPGAAGGGVPVPLTTAPLASSGVVPWVPG